MNTTTAVKQIELMPASRYRREQYGVVLTSATVHDFTGQRVHNQHHTHTLDVWENKHVAGEHVDCDATCTSYIDPHGLNTSERYSYLFSPNAVVISAHREPLVTSGVTLSIGDVVELTLHGFVIATIRIAAKSLHDPHGELV